MTQRPTKRCPECAEDVIDEARKCRYCGYRFVPDRSGQFNLLSFLFLRRPNLTPRQLLDAWGVILECGESVALLALGHVDSRHGYLTVTNRRILFIEHRGRHTYHRRFEQPLRSITNCDVAARDLIVRGPGFQISVQDLRGQAATTARDLIADAHGLDNEPPHEGTT